MLKRRIGKAFVVIGAVLMASALLLFLYNAMESKEAGQASANALASIRDAIQNPTAPADGETLPEDDQTQPTEETAPETIPEPTELTIVEVDGYNYIGFISVPNLEMELPVMEDWSMEQLQTAPCLQYGSPITDDAVIAAHNFDDHFKPLHHIEPGERVDFVDNSGYVFEYEVVKVKTMDPTNVYEVIESEHDLILYTCTTGGQYRVVVFCDRLDKLEDAKG